MGKKIDGIKVKIKKAGGPVKKIRFSVAATVIVAIWHQVEGAIGSDVLPSELEYGLAELLIVGAGLAADLLAWLKKRKQDAAGS